MFVEKKNVNEPSAFSKYLKLKIKPKPGPILVFFVWFWFFCLFVSLRYFFVILSLFILSQNTELPHEIEGHKITTCSLFIASVFQVLSCFAQNNNDVFIPTPKVKTLEPRLTSTTPLPVTEKNLWGLRLWQVMALALFATIVLSK